MPIQYRFPPAMVLVRVPSLVCGRRSAYADFTAAFAAIGTSPIVLGGERIPQRESFVALMNHFHRPDIPSWWFAMAMCKAIGDRRIGYAPHEPRMLVATHWTYPDWFHRATIGAASAFAVGRIIHAYGFLRMEPPALGADGSVRRARSMRLVLEAARHARRSREVIGVAPEGGDTPGGVMARPPRGAGRFLLLLAATGLPFVPFGLYLEGERLAVNVGDPFALPDRHEPMAAAPATKDDLDEWALRETMGRVARLVPAELRGYYAAAAPS